MKHSAAIGLVALTLLAACGSESDPQAAQAPPSAAIVDQNKDVAQVRHLSDRPLVFEDRASANGDPVEYLALFRTDQPFVKRGEGGETVAGTFTVGDADAGSDRYLGSIGPGTPRGKCYAWSLPASPTLAAADAKAPVAYAVTLGRSTRSQSGTTQLRKHPDLTELRRASKQIGCPITKVPTVLQEFSGTQPKPARKPLEGAP